MRLLSAAPSEPIRLFSRCSPAAAVEDAAKRSKTASSAASAGVLPPPKAAKRLVQMGRGKETRRNRACFAVFGSGFAGLFVYPPDEVVRAAIQGARQA